MEILERNKEIYTLYKSIFLKNYQLEDPNVICRRVSNLSEFAYKTHVGIFRDDFIEECLHWLGSPILNDHLPKINKKPERKIVHIISKYCVGGHISILQNTIAALKNYKHNIIFTQEASEKYDHIKSIFPIAKIKFLDQKNSEIQKAINLKNYCKQYETLFIFQNPEDCVPSIALSSRNQKQSVYYFNHADHAFWLGADICDYTVEIREVGKNISQLARNLRRSFVIELPIKVKERINKQKNSGKILAISMASKHKFMPKENYNFFKTWKKILNRQNNLVLGIVGLEQKDLPKFIMHHPRVITYGIVKDPTKILLSADLAVDPIPMGSYTSLLEICSLGSFPVFNYNPLKIFDLSNDPSFIHLKVNISSEEDYISNVLNLCLYPEKLINRGHKIREKILKDHSIEKYKNQLSKILSKNYEEKLETEFSGDLNFEHDRMARINFNQNNYDQLLHRVLKENVKLNLKQIFLKRNLIKLLGGNLRDLKYSMKN